MEMTPDSVNFFVASLHIKLTDSVLWPVDIESFDPETIQHGHIDMWESHNKEIDALSNAKETQPTLAVDYS